MTSIERLHAAWQIIAENRIQAAQEEGSFDNLPGMGRPLEDFVDLSDEFGWIRRTVRDVRDATERRADRRRSDTE